MGSPRHSRVHPHSYWVSSGFKRTASFLWFSSAFKRIASFILVLLSIQEDRLTPIGSPHHSSGQPHSFCSPRHSRGQSHSYWFSSAFKSSASFLLVLLSIQEFSLIPISSPQHSRGQSHSYWFSSAFKRTG